MTYISLEQYEDKPYGCFTRLAVSGHRLGLLYITISIPIHSNELQPLNFTQHWSHWRPWDAQLQSGGPRRSACFDLPRNLVLKRLSCLNLLRDPPVQGSRKSTCLNLPGDPILGRPTCLDLPGDSVSRRLSCLTLPGDAWLSGWQQYWVE